MEEIPFEFVQNIGTNAGFDFDIENGKIVSRLICHEKDGELIYMDSELGNKCLSLSTKPIRVDELNIQAYPNPFNASFFLNFGFEGDKKIRVYNSHGKLLVSEHTKEIEMEMHLPNEMTSTLYLVEITTDFGVFSKKVLRIKD